MTDKIVTYRNADEIIIPTTKNLKDELLEILNEKDPLKFFSKKDIAKATKVFPKILAKCIEHCKAAAIKNDKYVGFHCGDAYSSFAVAFLSPHWSLALLTMIAEELKRQGLTVSIEKDSWIWIKWGD